MGQYQECGRVWPLFYFVHLTFLKNKKKATNGIVSIWCYFHYIGIHYFGNLKSIQWIQNIKKKKKIENVVTNIF
jgi:hypothetical protein